MLRRATFLLFLLSALGLNSLAAPQRPVYSISGTVIDSLTGQPLDHTEVSIASTTNTEDAHTFLTSSDGRFLFTNLPAAKFNLAAGRFGYVHQNFHQHEIYSTAVVTGPGQNSENLRFPLARSALITGAVTDEWSDPLRGAEVLIFEYGFAGGSRSSHVAGRATTDDLGHYRFAHLMPGNYTVMVIAKPWYAIGQMENLVMRELPQTLGESTSFTTQLAPLPGFLSPIFDVVYPVIFYPNAQSLAEAGKLSLSPGAAQTADFALRPVPSIHLFVRTPLLPRSSGGNDANDDGQPPDGFNFDIERRIGEYSDNPVATRREIAPGLSELSGIPPGEVTLTASPVLSENVALHMQSLDLSTNREVDLSAHGALSDVSGVVLFAGNPPLPAEFTEGRALVAQSSEVQSTDEQSSDEQSSIAEIGEPLTTQLVFHSQRTGESFVTYVTRKGAFSMSDTFLPAGIYDISFQQLPTLQITSIEATGAKVSGRTIDIPSGQPVRLTIHTAEAKCSVSGVAVKNGKPVEGAMLLLVPQDPSQDPSTFHRDQSDSDGSFLMSPLFPGHYTLLAIENGWDLEWASASVLFRYLPNGIPVDLKPDATAHFTVPVQ